LKEKQMSLLGRAVVAIWNDIVPEERANFIDWHNREHIPERVAIEGFLRGRRYIAKHGSPEYFTLYEADNEAVLSGSEYLERLNKPTPWTRDATKAFRNTTRGVCGTSFSTGPGDGGYLATIRFNADPGSADEFSARLRPALADISKSPTLCGVHLCIADKKASGIETQERKGRDVSVPDWVVLIEGSWSPAIDKAVDLLLAGDLGSHGATGALERGLYRLEFSLASKTALVADR
jgi:hypothetical protein